MPSVTVSVPEALREIPAPPCSLTECDTDPGTLSIPPSLPGLGTQRSANPEGLTQLTTGYFFFNPSSSASSMGHLI